MTMHVDLVVPAYNEADNLQRTVARTVETLREDATDWTFGILLVVSDLSDDATPALADELAATNPEVSTLHRDSDPGFGNAVAAGLSATGGDVVIPFMADLSDDPSDVSAMVEAVRAGYDVVYGSRFIEGGSVDGYPPLKLLYNRAYNNTIRLLFGIRSKDVTNAFTAYTREVIDTVDVGELDSEGFDITAELPLRAHIAGFRSTEVPVNWRGREAGISKLNATRAGPQYGRRLLEMFVLGNAVSLRDLFASVADQGRARVLGAATVGVLLLVALFSLSGFDEVFQIVFGASPIWILGAAGSYLLSFAFRTWRWRVLLRTAGHLGSRGNVFRCLLFGWFLNFLLPARVGDVGRGFALRSTAGVPFSVGTGTVVIERVLDLLVLGAGMLLVAATFVPGRRTVLMAGGTLGIAAGLIVALAMLYVLPEGAVARLDGVIPSFSEGLETLSEALERTTNNPFAVTLATLLTVPVWITEVGTLFFSARAIGIDPGALATAVAAISAFVVQSLPLTPAGIGTYETTIAGVLGGFGVDTGTGTALALVDHFARLAVVYVFGAISAVHIGFRSRAYFRDRSAETVGIETNDSGS